MLTIHDYDPELAQKYREIEAVLYDILGKAVEIHHVGSSALGISGKNIIDILIGVPKMSDMRPAADKLVKAGYFEGGETEEQRIFLASRREDTKDGDVHVHICVKDSPVFTDFLVLRDYLRAYPDELAEYEAKKREFAMQSGGDRREYRQLKSSYIIQLLEKAHAAIAQEKPQEY